VTPSTSGGTIAASGDSRETATSSDIDLVPPRKVLKTTMGPCWKRCKSLPAIATSASACRTLSSAKRQADLALTTAPKASRSSISAFRNALALVACCARADSKDCCASSNARARSDAPSATVSALEPRSAICFRNSSWTNFNTVLSNVLRSCGARLAAGGNATSKDWSKGTRFARAKSCSTWCASELSFNAA